MTALIVIACILLFFFLLLLCPLHIYAAYENELSARIRLLLFTFKILPQPEEKEEELKEAAKEKIEKVKDEDTLSKIRGIIQQKGLSGFLNLIQEIASIATGAAKKFFSHIVIDSIFINVSVADEDAAQAAILYGGVCAGIYTPMGLLLSNMKCKRYHINVVPNFQEKECKINFELKSHIRLLFVISLLLSALLKSLKVYKKIKSTSKN